MSTKTLLKRIALVAVSAMGFGLLSSVAPASASTTALTITSTARAGVGATITITSDSATATEHLHWSLISAPTGGTFATGAGQLDGSGTTSDYTVNVTHDTNTSNLVAGTYTLLVWANAISGNTAGAGKTYPNIGDVTTTHTMIVAGAPSSVAVTSPTAAESCWFLISLES
jgi:hypothetical protein